MDLRGFSKCIYGVCRGYFKGVLMVFLRSINGVSKEFLWYFESISSFFLSFIYRIFERVSKVFRGRSEGVKMYFRGQ